MLTGSSITSLFIDIRCESKSHFSQSAQSGVSLPQSLDIDKSLESAVGVEASAHREDVSARVEDELSDVSVDERIDP